MKEPSSNVISATAITTIMLEDVSFLILFFNFFEIQCRFGTISKLRNEGSVVGWSEQAGFGQYYRYRMGGWYRKVKFYITIRY